MDFKSLIQSTFKLGLTYTSQEIKYEFENVRKLGVGIPNSENPMAFTYNRWNRGMTEILPCFIYHWNEYYEFVGFDFEYSGPIYHVPGKEHERYIIGDFQSGKFEFRNGFQSLEEWKNSDFNGYAVAEVGRKIDVLFDSNQVLKFLFIDAKSDTTVNVTDGYRHVRADSNLGQRILGQSKGHCFEFNHHVYEIIEVNG
jgi:hypothetical protein